MKVVLLCLCCSLSVLAQTTPIKENLGTTINSAEDQILPVLSLDGQTLYFSENTSNGRYEIWFSERDDAGYWKPKQKANDLNPPTDGSKYVFAHVEEDLFLVNGWFAQNESTWTQSKGLSWYIPSQKQFINLDIPALQTQAKGRFVNAFLHRSTKVLVLSYAENGQKDLYICQPENATASWTEMRWQPPQRLPAILNSEFDETTPFLDVDGKTLYFASNRLGGYGEQDIYRSQRLDASWTRWSTPENLGFGVNSNRSEIYYSVSPLRDFVYFVSYKHSYGSGDIFHLKTDATQRDVETLMATTTNSIQTSVASTKTPQVTELDVKQYKPNNLVFLIDLSSSMKSPEKLPLLKLSLKRLIGELRDIDRLTLISFSNAAKIDVSKRGVTKKDSLYNIIDNFVAAGRTRANQGLQLAYDYTEENFIQNGNNEIILVTDGLFRLSTQDRQRIEDNLGIVFSTVGLGENRNALNNLRTLATKTNGSFIHILHADTDIEALLEEVKARSRF
jgi:Mg-chelatase subunit ChlD